MVIEDVCGRDAPVPPRCAVVFRVLGSTFSELRVDGVDELGDEGREGGVGDERECACAISELRAEAAVEAKEVRASLVEGDHGTECTRHSDSARRVEEREEEVARRTCGRGRAPASDVRERLAQREERVLHLRVAVRRVCDLPRCPSRVRRDVSQQTRSCRVPWTR